MPASLRSRLMPLNNFLGFGSSSKLGHARPAQLVFLALRARQQLRWSRQLEQARLLSTCLVVKTGQTTRGLSVHQKIRAETYGWVT
ncbi:hypothetical protein [Propionimicrobium sp. PCR01-08-3]|uniref:hypothetical protein n=1 Tax=Propionimicrobium sp. PCR01-08-3 TaxID=3052086 RepID=UPI00255C4016|nr:hypothetical protein [Propionimicrobium sp. PCR01-08-3]WIY82690.1 hypothetical protein QQ658_14500 [Propionimicrobium sp. PCR01-08-3]